MTSLKTLAAAALAAAALIAPATADAAYNITQRQAEHNAIDAAEYRYSYNGVSADAAYCHPQGLPIRDTDGRPGEHISGRYHRWTCGWVGTDGNGAYVYGEFRITGHSDGTYGYLAVRGGMHWS